jgi:carbonic anhydrase/acetyltransferase-like protein (isoleucine patch superfamily)
MLLLADGYGMAATGHGATIHAATIQDGSLIGMGAVLLDGVTVGATFSQSSWVVTL